MKTQIIEHRLTGCILFEFECATLRECVTEAVKQKKSLQEADLRGADLQGANLQDADLRGADL